MAVLVDENTKVICQCFTGSQGTFHSEQAMRLRHQDGRRRHAVRRRPKDGAEKIVKAVKG